MKTRRTAAALIALMMAFSLASCGKKTESQFKELNLNYCYPHPAEQVTFLELDWGSGDNQVGYINEEFRESVEKGLQGSTLGPQDFCIDGEGSIYLLDTMNYRVLKYSEDGSYLGIFDINRIGSFAGGIASGPDCLYIYHRDHGVVWRYRFQDDEIKELDFSELGIGFKIGNELLSLYDGLGNSYFSENAYSGPNSIYYKIDPSFSFLIEERLVPWDLSVVQFIDDDGTFYAANRCEPNPDNLALYRIDPSGTVATVAVYPADIDKNTEAYLSHEPVNLQDLIIYIGYYITRDGRLVQRLKGTQNRVFRHSRDVKVYWMQERPYKYDDKSPFRIYRVDVAWDQIN